MLRYCFSWLLWHDKASPLYYNHAGQIMRTNFYCHTSSRRADNNFDEIVIATHEKTCKSMHFLEKICPGVIRKAILVCGRWYRPRCVKLNFQDQHICIAETLTNGQYDNGWIISKISRFHICLIGCCNFKCTADGNCKGSCHITAHLDYWKSGLVM